MSSHLKGRVMSVADSSSLLYADHSPVCSFQASVDTALERADAGLSNAASTSIWKPCSDDRLACKSELESASLITRPLRRCGGAGLSRAGLDGIQGGGAG